MKEIGRESVKVGKVNSDENLTLAHVFWGFPITLQSESWATTVLRAVTMKWMVRNTSISNRQMSAGTSAIFRRIIWKKK